MAGFLKIEKVNEPILKENKLWDKGINPLLCQFCLLINFTSQNTMIEEIAQGGGEEG